MATQDELRELVTQTLEAKGVLGSIRVRGDARARPQAHLRAAVYTAIDEHERESGVHLANPRLAPLKSAHEGAGAPRSSLQAGSRWDSSGSCWITTDSPSPSRASSPS